MQPVPEEDYRVIGEEILAFSRYGELAELREYLELVKKEYETLDLSYFINYRDVKGSNGKIFIFL